jgi:hypothetical protein
VSSEFMRARMFWQEKKACVSGLSTLELEVCWADHFHDQLGSRAILILKAGLPRGRMPQNCQTSQIFKQVPDGVQRRDKRIDNMELRHTGNT